MISASQMIQAIREMAEMHDVTVLVMCCAPEVPGQLSNAFGWSSGSALSNIATEYALVRIEQSPYVPPGTLYVVTEEVWEDMKYEMHL